MLKQDFTGNSGSTPPEFPGEGPGVGAVEVANAANAVDFARDAQLARRHRRDRRAARSVARVSRGWSVGMW